MRIATYNVNGVNGRLANLLQWLAENTPDVVCLQELKAPDEKFPAAAIGAAGYEAIWHGQKSWNGVAILARGAAPKEICRGLPGEPDDTHSRYIEAAIDGVIIGCLSIAGAPLDHRLYHFPLAFWLCCKALGARRWKARSKGDRAVSDFKGRHFEGEIVLWAVRWYCRYGISYRDLEQMMTERGVSVDHSTIYRWVQRYAPEIEKRLRWHWRRPRSRSWRVDETYVKVRGKWSYLYRAVDKLGNTIDFYLSPTWNTIAAKRFLAKALTGLKDWEQPAVINTDKAPTYAAALAELKAEGKCPKDTQHRQVKYLNNIVEADHGKLKQLIRPVRGFKSMKTAYATIKGFEVMRALRKGQAAVFNLTRDIVGEARLVERAFSLGPCALTEAVQLVNERLQAA